MLQECRRVTRGLRSSRARRERREIVLRQRYGLLLVSLVLLFIVQGVGPAGPWQEVLVTALATATLVLALRAGEVTPRFATVATVVGTGLVIVVAVMAAVGVSNAAVARVAGFALVFVAPPAVVVGVVRGLREQGSATVQAVMGVLCIYLLIGMLCAFLYGAIDRLGGDPFFAQNVAATGSRCLYFSFTTLTTVGYGDLTARTNLGHTLAVTEALVGQIYLVTVVALLVVGPGAAGARASNLIRFGRRGRRDAALASQPTWIASSVSSAGSRCTTSGRFAPRWPTRSCRRWMSRSKRWSGSAPSSASTPRRSPCASRSIVAYRAGATEDEIVGVLLAIAPAVGNARTVAVAPRLALALGYDVEDSVRE